MKKYFPKNVFKYQLSINAVNLQKTKQIFLNNVQKQTFWLANVYKCEQNTFIFLTNVEKRIFRTLIIFNKTKHNTKNMFLGILNTLSTFLGPIKKLIKKIDNDHDLVILITK